MDHVIWPVGAETYDAMFKGTIWSLTNAELQGLIILTCQMDKDTFKNKWWYHVPQNEEMLLVDFPEFASIIFLDRVQLAEVV